MKIIFLLLFVAVGQFCIAQNSVTGEITDQKTQEPLTGSTVYIPKLEKGTITDFDGKFKLESIPDGNYEVIISSLGYAKKSIEIQVPLTKELKVQLAPSAIEMEEVIVSTPFHQLQSENVMKVERAGIEELAQQGALSLASGITKIAGVQSITTGSGVGKPVIRGLSSNRVLVYTQGVRLENQQFGGEHGLGVSSSGVESVEVIKGPASLLYGSDALGGVLYLNPEKYAQADSTQIDAKTQFYSNTLGLEANAGFKTSGEKLKFLVRGNYATHSDYKTGDGKRVPNTRFNIFDLKTGLGFQNKSYKGDLRYNLNSNRTAFPNEGYGQSKSKKVEEPFQKVYNHILSLDNKFYLENSSIDVKVGYLFNNRQEFEEEHHHPHNPENPEPPVSHHHDEAALEMHLETLNYDAKYNLPKMGKFQTIVGIQGMFQSNTNFGEELLIPDATTADFGVLATTHYHLEKIDFQAGLRYDTRHVDGEQYGNEADEQFIAEVNRNFNSYNGALGAKFDLFPNLRTRINLATGFRAPNLAELTSNGSHHGSRRYEIGNSLLKSEQNYQLDLDLEYENEHIQVFANAFYNKINNYIYLNPTGEIRKGVPVYQYIQNDAALYGGESGIHIHPHPLDWLHWKTSYEMVVGKQIGGNYLPLIPAHSLNNQLRVENPKEFFLKDSYAFVNLKTAFKQNKTSQFETTTGSYSLLSAGFGGNIGTKLADLQLRVSGENLLNKTYFSHLSRLKPEGIPNMGRNISVSLKAEF